MKIQLLLCAREFIIDQGSNMLSAISIFEHLTLPSLPVLLPSFAVGTIATRSNDEPDKIKVSMRIDNEDHSLYSGEVEFGFLGTKRVRNIMQFNGMPVLKPGNLSITLKIGDEVLGSYAVFIEALAPIQAKPTESQPIASSPTNISEAKPAKEASTEAKPGAA